MAGYKRWALLCGIGILIVSGLFLVFAGRPVLRPGDVQVLATMRPVSRSSEIVRSGEWRYVIDVHVSGLAPQSSAYMLSIYPYADGNPTSVLELASMAGTAQLHGNEGLVSGWNGQELERLYRALRKQHIEPEPDWIPEGVTYHRSPASKFNVRFGVTVDDGKKLIRPDAIKVVAIYTEPGVVRPIRWEKVVSVTIGQH